jgi:hypothetical protein
MDQTASWMAEKKCRAQHIENMQYTHITREQLTLVINNSHIWKAPSNYKIHNNWLKMFTNTHSKLLHTYICSSKSWKPSPSFLHTD